MKQKKIPPFSIFALMVVFDELEARFDAAEPNFHRIDQLLQLEGYDALLRRYPGHKTRLAHLRGAAKKWQDTEAKIYRSKAKNHLFALRKTVRPVAADTPFEIKDRVWVKRYEHGYDVGTGTVVWRSPLPNPSYTVRLDPDDGGYEVHVPRTSWLRPSY